MRLSKSGVFVLSLFLSLHAISEPDLKVGDEVQIQKAVLVRLAEPAQNSNVFLEAGDSCLLNPQGVVKIVELSDDGKKALGHYTIPHPVGGSRCPSGSEFWAEVSKFQELKAETETLAAARKEEKEAIENALSGKPSIRTVAALTVGQTHQIPEGKWIVVRNVIPVTQFFRNGSERLEGDGGSKCIVESGERVEVLGFLKDQTRVIVKYLGGENVFGTPCPNGVIYFETADRLAQYNPESEAKRVELARVQALRDSIVDGKGQTKTFEGLTVDQKITVTKWATVEVANAKPVYQYFANERYPVQEGASCRIQEGGTLIILGFDTVRSTALVRYEYSGPGRGTPCPSGVHFFMTTKKLREFLK